MMNTRKNMTGIEINGNTYNSRKILKENGWKWNASMRAWTKNTTQKEIDHIKDLGYEAQIAWAKTHGANRQGCIVTANNGSTVLWKSAWFQPTEEE